MNAGPMTKARLIRKYLGRYGVIPVIGEDLKVWFAEKTKAMYFAGEMGASYDSYRILFEFEDDMVVHDALWSRIGNYNKNEMLDSVMKMVENEQKSADEIAMEIAAEMGDELRIAAGGRKMFFHQ